MTDKMQHYICKVCGVSWAVSGRISLAAIGTTCTGCLNEATDKHVVWLVHAGTKDDKPFYNICDDDGGNLRHPEGVKVFATFDDWKEIYDMCEVRIFEEPDPLPKPATINMVEEGVEEYKERFRYKLATLENFTRNEILTLIDTI